MKIITYKNQPDNVGAWQLGEACSKASKYPVGDHIDRGLALLKELQDEGYGVVMIAAAPPPAVDEDVRTASGRDLDAIAGHTLRASRPDAEFRASLTNGDIEDVPKDAERYRWLISRLWVDFTSVTYGVSSKTLYDTAEIKERASAIDAAMRASAEGRADG